MKKILALATGAALLFSASILTSCGDMTGDETNYSAATDTVITLSAPDVHGNAYYGVNYVWWNPVTSAKIYLVYRNGQYVGSKISGQTLEFVDAVNTPAGSLTAIEDNKSYKYEVVATNDTTITSTTDTVARQVYLRDNKGSVSLTAKVPTTEEFNKAVQNSLSYTKDATFFKSHL